MTTTLTLIATITPNGTSDTVATFSNIPSSYRDLVLISHFKNNTQATAYNGYVRLNNDTGSRYSLNTIHSNSINQMVVQRTGPVSQLYNVLDTYTDWVQHIYYFSNANSVSTTGDVNFLKYESSALEAQVNASATYDAQANLSTITINSSDLNGDVWTSGSRFSLYGIVS